MAISSSLNSLSVFISAIASQMKFSFIAIWLCDPCRGYMDSLLHPVAMLPGEAMNRAIGRVSSFKYENIKIFFDILYIAVQWRYD